MVETKEDDCICTELSKDLDTPSELKYTTLSCITYFFYRVTMSYYYHLQGLLLKWSQFKISGPMSPCELNQCKGVRLDSFERPCEQINTFSSCKKTAFQPNHSHFLVRKQVFFITNKKARFKKPSTFRIHWLVSSTAQPLDAAARNHSARLQFCS